MSPFFEHLVVVGIMSFLVALFTWIYVRDRKQSRGLWVIGWMAMLGHVSTNLFSGSALVSAQWIAFLRILALEIASVSFLLSFSELYTGFRKRGVFLFVVEWHSLLSSVPQFKSGCRGGCNIVCCLGYPAPNCSHMEAGSRWFVCR